MPNPHVQLQPQTREAIEHLKAIAKYFRDLPFLQIPAETVMPLQIGPLNGFARPLHPAAPHSPPCTRHLRMFALGVRPRNILRPSMSAGSAVPTINPPSTEIIALKCTQQDRCTVAVYLSVSAVYKIDRSHECVLISMNRRTHVHVCISNVYNEQ